MGVASIWFHFTGWTTAHGVPHIGSSVHWSLKAFWTIVVLIGLGLFCWQFYNIVSNYLMYPVNIGITVYLLQSIIYCCVFQCHGISDSI